MRFYSQNRRDPSHRSPVRVQPLDGLDLVIFIWYLFFLLLHTDFFSYRGSLCSSGHTELHWISSLRYLLKEGTYELDGIDLHLDIEGPDGL